MSAPCVNVAGTWNGSETVTVTCTVAGETATDTFYGAGTIVIQQNGCSISYDLGGVTRTGTVQGSNVEISGPFIIPAPGVTVTQNLFTGTGTTDGSTMTLNGSGVASGTVSGLGPFTCTGTSYAVFTRAGMSSLTQALSTGTVIGRSPVGKFGRFTGLSVVAQ